VDDTGHVRAGTRRQAILICTDVARRTDVDDVRLSVEAVARAVAGIDRRQHPESPTLWVPPTEGSAMSDHSAHPTPEHIPAADEPSVPEIEDDQTVAPRPEEEIADVLRATPDVADHSQPGE
jgi:hypothetical protein